MSETKVIILLRCHWPGCVNTHEVVHYNGVWHDCKWDVEHRYGIHPGRSLCPEHANEGFEKLDELIQDADRMGTL